MITPFRTKYLLLFPFNMHNHTHGILNKIRIIPHIHYIMPFSLNIESFLHVRALKTVLITASQSSYSHSKICANNSCYSLFVLLFLLSSTYDIPAQKSRCYICKFPLWNWSKWIFWKKAYIFPMHLPTVCQSKGQKSIDCPLKGQLAI